MGFSLGFFAAPIICRAGNNNGTGNYHALDASYIKRAAVLTDKSAGFTSPHPNFGCVIATDGGHVAGEGYLSQKIVPFLLMAGITRVVVGIRHPLQHLRGNAVRALRCEGLQVDVLGEDLQSKTIEEALTPCLLVNAPLLYRAASRIPFSVLKKDCCH